MPRGMLVIVVQRWPVGVVVLMARIPSGRLRPFLASQRVTRAGFLLPITHTPHLSSADGQERILFIRLVGRLKLLTTEFRQVLSKC